MLNLSNLLIFLLFFTLFKSNSTNDEQNGKKVQEIDKDAAKNYLQHYGYWPLPNVSLSSIGFRSQAENEELLALREALKKFQESLGLEPTGLLDATTQEKIARPRCGVPDFGAIGESRGAPRRWNKSNITYSIIKFSEDMSQRTFRGVIRKAFDLWSEVIPLNFIEMPDTSSTADIKIEFGTREHGDPWSFDGKDGTLAHATYPPNGNIHFDDDENWVYLDASKIESKTHVDILNVALHEIGHAIGLEHIIESETAIMAPFYLPTLDLNKNYMPPKLTVNDISAAREIYGPRREPYNGIGNLPDDEGDADSRKYKKAIEDYTKAIELNPTDAIAYNNRGIAQRNLGKYNEAIADYTKAIELNPTYADAYYNRGFAQNSLGKYNEAVADYTKAIELKPGYASAYYNRGIAQNSLGKYNEAIADYTKAIKLNPTHANAYTGRGIAHRNLEKYNEAIADYTKAIELNPTHIIAYYNRGNAQRNLGKYNEAIADYTKAIELKPGFDLAIKNRKALMDKINSKK